MIKRVLMLACLIGVTASLPAYASPTKKKVTVTCTSVAPATIYGIGTAIFSDSTGDTFSCPLVCDNSGSPGVPVSNSTDCVLSFRDQYLAYTLYYQYTDANGVVSDATSTGAPVSLNGSGFTTQNGPGGGDAVTLKVK